MTLAKLDFIVGAALSCTNKADELINRSVPDSLVFYIDDLRRNFSSPIYLIEFQPERMWMEFRDNAFRRKENNRWIVKFKSDKNLRYEIFQQPRIIGVHAPIKEIDILSSSNFKKQQSVASIIESIRWANEIDADYFIYHLAQDDYWVSDDYRRNNLIPQSLRVFADIASVYKIEKHRYVMCIEILEYPKYPATPYETKQILETCQQILPGTKLAFDLSHLWRSRSLICETQSRGFENIRSKKFGEILSDTLSFLKPDDIFIFHLGGCWETETHNVPGIYPYEDPYNANYRLDTSYYSFDESREINISEALDKIIDFCIYNNQPLRLVLEIHQQIFPVILKAIDEINKALFAKARRR